MESSPVLNKAHHSMSASSFVTQRTAVTISPRESVKADEQLATVMSISPPPLPVQLRDTIKKMWVYSYLSKHTC